MTIYPPMAGWHLVLYQPTSARLLYYK